MHKILTNFCSRVSESGDYNKASFAFFSYPFPVLEDCKDTHLSSEPKAAPGPRHWTEDVLTRPAHQVFRKRT